jgi:hypothetical protein
MRGSHSMRWLRSGVAMFGCGVLMFAASILSHAFHAPHGATVAFFVLLPVSALAGFILIGVGVTKAKAENERLAAQAVARARATTNAKRYGSR